MKKLEISEVKITYKSKVKASERPKVCKSQESYKILKKYFDAKTIELKESFKILLLNRANKVLGVMNVSEGGINETTVDIRLIMQSVILSNASGMILSHNHPSGELTPSPQDMMITTRIRKVCELMNINLLDHIILTSEGYYSFTDEGNI